MSIKECLEAFVAHVQALKEEDEAGDDGYTKEFQMLKQQSNQYRVEGTFSTSEGEKEYNRRKNRYKDILPFDYTRVILPKIPGLIGSDYINANFIKGATCEKAYIASQGPLTHTVADFWRMIWNNKVKVIVMTANEYEGGKMKCACYWPKTPEERQYGDISVTLVEEKERGNKDFIVRQLRAKKGQDVRIVQQLHYIAWPDHAIPSSANPLLEMVAVARDIQPEDMPPLLVHCSAGCGRTGTLCAIDYAWTLLKMGQITSELSLYEIIYEMRRQRPSSVQALDQYVLVHQAVSQLFSRHLTLINQHYNLPDSIHSSTTDMAPPMALEPYYDNIPKPDGVCRPELEQGRKPLPLPKPKTSPPSPDQQQADRRTPTSSASPPVPTAYAYADPNSLGRWHLQHVARGVPFDAMLEDGDYAELKNPCRGPAVSPTLHPWSTSAGQYEEVGACGFSGNGERDSLSDDDSPDVPPKLQDNQTTPGEQGDDESITGQMSRSLDTLSGSVTTGVLTLGRRLKQKVQQTFGKTAGSPTDGLMLGSPPGTSGSDSAHNTRGMAIFYKGMDISFPHRVPAPRGPRQQTGVTSPDAPTRGAFTRH